jgi:hypothetical protein
MKRLPNGGVRYNDDFWFERSFLLVLLGGCAAAASIEFTRRHYVLGTLSVIAAVAAAYALLTGQRRTYLFSPSTAIMMWISRGLFARDGGEVEFKDIAITLDAGHAFSWFGRSSPLSWVGGWGTPIEYDIMLRTPTLRAHLWRSLRGDYETAIQEATALRGLLDQSADSLVEDSIAQMLQDGNKLGAKCLARERSSSSSRSATQFDAQAP